MTFDKLVAVVSRQLSEIGFNGLSILVRFGPRNTARHCNLPLTMLLSPYSARPAVFPA